MTIPLFVRRLKVSAFRGIPEELTLPLDARATLIHAPNGTGKTSICDAAEWLLTGRVERLNATEVRGEHGLRCKFVPPDGPPTFVEADIELAGETMTLRREDGRLRLNHQPIENAAWLRKVALPDADSRMAGNAAAVSRSTWIRGTRFLSGETLSLLLDPGLETNRREQIFADLFGVRQIIDQEKLLQDFAAGVSQRLDRESARLEDFKARATALRAELKSRVSSSSPDMYAATQQVLQRAHATLIDAYPPAEELLSSTNASAVEDQIALLRAATNAAIEANNRAQSSLAYVLESLPLLFSESIDEQVRAEISSADQSLARYRAELTEARDQARRAEADREQHELQLEHIAAAQERIRLRRVAAVASSGRSALEPHAVSRPESLPELRLSAEERRQRRDALTKVIALANDAEIREFDAGALREQEAQLAAQPAADVTQLRLAVATSEQSLLALRAQHSETRGGLRELRLASRHFLGADHQAQHCPVCDHDWGSADALRAALQRAQSSLSEVERSIEARTLEAEQAAQAARTTLRYAEDSAVQLKTIRARLRQIEEQEDRFKYFLSAAGLREAHASYEAVARQALARLEAADDLAALSMELTQVAVDLGISVDSAADPLRVADFFENEVQSQTARLQARLAFNAAQLRGFQARQESLVTNISAAERLRSEAASRLESWNAERARLRDAWGDVGVEGELSATSAERARSILNKRAQDLMAADQLLENASTLIGHAALQAEVSRLEESIGEGERRTAELREARDLAARTASTFQIERRQQSTEQLTALTRVFSPLFGRAQANEVFDRVGGDPVRWRAYAAGEEFDPTEHFSQGQRQDFALSLFLARARTIGGTFFLDEPMSHLDDLNRVALLDVVRMLALEAGSSVELVMTTASESLVRQLASKFAPLTQGEAQPNVLFRAIDLRGNGRSGVSSEIAAEL